MTVSGICSRTTGPRRLVSPSETRRRAWRAKGSTPSRSTAATTKAQLPCAVTVSWLLSWCRCFWGSADGVGERWHDRPELAPRFDTPRLRSGRCRSGGLLGLGLVVIASGPRRYARRERPGRPMRVPRALSPTGLFARGGDLPAMEPPYARAFPKVKQFSVGPAKAGPPSRWSSKIFPRSRGSRPPPSERLARPVHGSHGSGSSSDRGHHRRQRPRRGAA